MLGLSAVIPVLHGMEMYGVDDMQGRIGLYWLLLQGFLYILGAGLYAVSCTERASSSLSLTITGSLARTLVTWLL
jgi:adiponectin receptor